LPLRLGYDCAKFDGSAPAAMLSVALAFGTPRKLPKPREVSGRVVVLDIAFAGIGSRGGFERITQPFIDGLAGRLRLWVDHHDHREHARYARDPRFLLATKGQHPACCEMIDPELVQRVGPVDTIVCHTDFDGLASAAKWVRGGEEPYPGCDADASAVDTRMARPSLTADRIDRAVRARPRDSGLFGIVVRHLVSGLSDAALWIPIDEAASELIPVEQETRRAAQSYVSLAPGVALVNVSAGFRRVDKTLLLLLGQEREPVSVVVDGDTVSVAARFDSGIDFLDLFQLPGGMPTRVSLPRSRLAEVLRALGADPSALPSG
jgi:hypothetical protein